MLRKMYKTIGLSNNVHMHFFNTDLNYLAKLDSSSEMNVVVFKMPHLDSTNDGR